MDNNISKPSDIAMNTLSEVPTAKSGAQKITALVKDGSTVTGYQLNNGQIVSKQEAISMARNGEIANVGISTNQGTEYLKSLPDQDPSNNLDALPTITN